MGLYDEFRFLPAPWLPHSDMPLEELERCRNIKREVLAEHLARLGKRLGEVPEFAAYAIADGIKRAFTRFGKWFRTAADTIAKGPEHPAIQLLPGFAELLDIDDG